MVMTSRLHIWFTCVDYNTEIHLIVNRAIENGITLRPDNIAIRRI
jgi:hypothetical protein